MSDEELQKKVLRAVPQKTRQQTKWAIGIWLNWRLHQIKIAKNPDECPPRLAEMDKADLSKWLSKFLVEIRHNDGKACTGTTLHQILCGLQRHLWEKIDHRIDFFSDSEFRFLKSVLDSQMKELRSQGVGMKKKQAEPVTTSGEELLWKKGLLG